MGVREIGSEYWNENIHKMEIEKKKVFDRRKRGFLCGRTALEYIIRDAKASIGFDSVLLPSYCCHTMIEPFARNNISVRFYSVVMGEQGLEYILPDVKENEALYLIPYYGFGQLQGYNQKQIKQWKFCMLDETHSCFSDYQWDYSDWNIKYTYASYRKWADIKGFAVAEKIGDDFLLSYHEMRHTAYFEKKNDACSRKQSYMEENKGNKDTFLELYAESEEILETDYMNYTALQEGIQSYEILDRRLLVQRRRRNGRYLLDAFKNIPEIHLIFSCIQEGDCPLFIPILVENNLRNELRKFLIEKDIYCPVHWPVSEYHKLRQQEKVIYEQELSIICDQRYEIDDMHRIVQSIQEFFCKDK